MKAVKPGEEVKIGDIEAGSIVMGASGVYFVKGSDGKNMMVLINIDTEEEVPFLKTVRFTFIANPKPSRKLALITIQHYLRQ